MSNQHDILKKIANQDIPEISPQASWLIEQGDTLKDSLYQITLSLIAIRVLASTATLSQDERMELAGWIIPDTDSTKSETVRWRLTETEYAHIILSAAARGLSISAYMRDRLGLAN